MNYKLLVIALVVLGYAYRAVLELMQLRSAQNPTPENVADVYDGPTYLRWQAYLKEKSRLNLYSVAVSLTVTVVLLATNAHAAFASLFPEVWMGQICGVLLLQNVADLLVQLPFSYIHTMVIEEKYGFNRSSLKTFLFDQLRSFLLGLALSFFLMYLLAVLHIRLGHWLILLFAAVVFAFSLVISFFYPYLSRIGNKFTPLEDGELKDKLLALLEKHGYRVKAIQVMDASRRTTKLNAYFTGFGKLKTIVLYDNLVNAMTTEEICAVFAHELGHGLHKDVLKHQVLSIGNLLLMALTVWGTLQLPMAYVAFGFTGYHYGFSYILLDAALSVLQPLTGLGMNCVLRRDEFAADRQAVEEGYGPAMVQGLKKLARENFAHLAPSRALVLLEYSHPPLSQRIAAVEALQQSREGKE